MKGYKYIISHNRPVVGQTAVMAAKKAQPDQGLKY